jgi:probable rRNA maturation factor
MVILHKPVPQLTEAKLERFLLRAKRAAGLRGVVNVLLTSSRQLRAWNARFRGKDHPTDVLSFPPLVKEATIAGDIAISVDIAKQNGRRFGHAPADEVRILVLHGLLHLAGYDHESDAGAMETKEGVLRKKLGLPVGLIERTQMVPTRQTGAGQSKRGSQRGKASVKKSGGLRRRSSR